MNIPCEDWLIYSCPRCNKVLAREDIGLRSIGESLFPTNGTKVEVKPGQAPRLVCTCGKVLLLMEGRL